MIKNFLKTCLAQAILIICDMFRIFSLHNIEEDKAKKILSDGGYSFPELWQNMDPLLDSKIELSLIIPVYNNEKYIEHCLSSVLGQSTKYTYEVICIDDGSTDSSLVLLKKWQRKYPNRLKVYSQSNQGISKTRNRGLLLAQGQYVGFIDNDDSVSTDYVETLLDVAFKDNVDVVQTAYENVSSDGHSLGIVSHGDHIIESTNANELLEYTQGWIWGGILKKDIFERIRFPEDFWYEDMITRLVIIRSCQRIATIGRPMYFYLIHDSNASKTVWKKTSIKVVDELWLAILLSKYSDEVLNLPKNRVFYEILLEEFAFMLWARTHQLPTKIRKAIFSLASSYLKSLSYKGIVKNKFYKRINTSLLNGNFLSWNLQCYAHSLIK